MSLPFRVIGSRVLIKPDIEDLQPEQTASGLYVAKTLNAAATGADARQAWYTGEVVAFGEDQPAFDVRPYVLRILRDPDGWWDGDAGHAHMLARLANAIDELPQTRARDFALGDHVTFTANAGQELTIDGETYLILNETDILGVLETA